MSDIQNTYELCVDLYGPQGGGGGGPRGFQGFQGDIGVGIQGFQGVQGFIGNIGTQGRQGVQGIGFQGLQGLQGSQGLVGPFGSQGVQGTQGVQGIPNAEFVLVTAYQELGSQIKTVNLNLLTGWLTSSIPLTSGTTIFVPVYLQSQQTVTGVMFEQDTQGVYTADNYNGFGVYSISGGTLTRVLASANDGNVFKNASNSFVKKAFSSTALLNPGVYYIGILYSSSAQTTQPTISGQTANFNLGRADFTNNYILCGTRTGQTTMLTSLAASTLSIGNNAPWVNLY